MTAADAHTVVAHTHTQRHVRSSLRAAARPVCRWPVPARCRQVQWHTPLLWGLVCSDCYMSCIRLCDQNRGARRIEGLSLFVLSASRCCVCARAVRGEGKRSRERDKHTRGAVRRTADWVRPGPPVRVCVRTVTHTHTHTCTPHTISAPRAHATAPARVPAHAWQIRGQRPVSRREMTRI